MLFKSPAQCAANGQRLVRGRAEASMAAEDIFEPLRRQMVEEIAAETSMLAGQLGRAACWPTA